MNILDIILIVLVVAYAVSGFRQGFLVGALGFAGLILGGLVGVVVAPPILRRFDPGLTVSIAALGIVLVAALIGQTLAAKLGVRLRGWVTWQPARFVDATGGAVLSAAALLVVAWILGTAVAGAHFGSLARVVRNSEILTAVNDVASPVAGQGLLAFSRLVDPDVFPPYLKPYAPERIEPARPPSGDIASDPDVRRASDSVVRVEGIAPSCSRSLEGSGFVYADHRVMTNAHVVAGVREPRVETRDGRSYDATVVVYDHRRDVAVLAVPGLGLPALDFDGGAQADAMASVLGYPGNGPFAIAPARIRSEQPMRGPGIYGRDQVVREVYALYAKVRPGNSGGPLISPDGSVYGMVFASSVEDPHTGYALTAREVARDARTGTQAQDRVPTGQCS